MMENKMDRKVMNEKELEQISGGVDPVAMTMGVECPGCHNTKNQLAYGTGANLTIKVECSSCKKHFLVNVSGYVFDQDW